jgi:hypothetical protein
MPEGGGERNSNPIYAFPNARVVSHFVPEMPVRVSALRSLGAYLNVFAIETWITAIRADEQFEPADHTSVQIDTWEDVHLGAEDRRREAEAAKMACEGALRSRFFDID